MIIEKNNYFEEKAITFDVMRRYFERHPLDANNIARLHSEEVDPADDIEQLIISDIIFFYAIWKKAGAIPAYYIRSIKMSTYAILRFNPTFTHLNADEYQDFIAIVKELNESKIDVLGDDS